MSTLTQTYLSLSDLYKRSDDGKSIAAVIELMNECNPVVKDIRWMEANMGTVHRHTVRTGLPTVTWDRLYQGTAQSKSQTQQVDDTTGSFTSMSTVDQRLLAIAPDKSALRLSEAYPHLEAQTQELATALFYHNTDTTPEKVKGASARYAVRGGGGAGNQVVHGGGSGSDNTSIWFITWGDNDTHAIYPKGTKGGVERIDRGQQRVTDASGNAYYVEEEEFRTHCGFAVKDWRNNARIANIDVSDVQAGSVDLYKLMRSAYYKLHRRRAGKIDNQKSVGQTIIYMNTDMLEALDALQTNSGGSDNFARLRPMELQGEEVMSYRGIPIRETDALINTEALVPAA